MGDKTLSQHDTGFEAFSAVQREMVMVNIEERERLAILYSETNQSATKTLRPLTAKTQKDPAYR